MILTITKEDVITKHWSEGDTRKKSPLSEVSRAMARRLERTKFGQKALAQPGGIGLLKQKPTPRVYAGLALVALSFLTGLPALVFLSYLSIKMSKSFIIAVGGPVVVVLAHVMFGVGVYLAGRNYATETLLWATKRFLEKYV